MYFYLLNEYRALSFPLVAILCPVLLLFFFTLILLPAVFPSGRRQTFYPLNIFSFFSSPPPGSSKRAKLLLLLQNSL